MPDNKQPRILAAEPRVLQEAARILREGGLVAVPTETVYGLAARADDVAAVARIYRAKGRPDFNPLIVHVSDLAQAQRFAHVDDRAMALAERFWPGPLTMVLPLRDDAALAAMVTAGLPTVALRCPAHPVMRELLAQTRLPLAAPSANRSGAISPTTAAHVAASLGANVDLIIDGGACAQGLESTIVALRHKVTGNCCDPAPSPWQRSPPFWAPILVMLAEWGRATRGRSRRRVNWPAITHRASRSGSTRSTADADEFHIGFGGVAGAISLSPSGNLAEAAARLYACLHAAAAAVQPRIAVAPVPDGGIGAAINDRLSRAAA